MWLFPQQVEQGRVGIISTIQIKAKSEELTPD